MHADLGVLEAAVEYRFKNRDLLHRALTHSSHVHESVSGSSPALRDNEQFEFLGDAVIGFLVSEALVAQLPDSSEGRLSTLKAHLVSATHLCEVAQKINLGSYLQLGRGEEMSGGRAKRTLLVDSFEALIAAMYLDGGIEPVRNLIHRFVLPDGAVEPAGDSSAHVDFKTALQELARARNLPAPRYITIKERGPEHSKTFTVEARVGKEWVSQAEGLSKKGASQRAARQVFEMLSCAVEAV